MFRNDIDLAHNTHLRSITLQIFWGYPPASMEWLFTLLSQIVSSHMVHVTFIFQVEDAAVLDNVIWTQIEDVFTQQRWANLQKLTLSWFSSESIRPAVRELIWARLPKLESRGILV